MGATVYLSYKTERPQRKQLKRCLSTPDVASLYHLWHSSHRLLTPAIPKCPNGTKPAVVGQIYCIFHVHVFINETSGVSGCPQVDPEQLQTPCFLALKLFLIPAVYRNTAKLSKCQAKLVCVCVLFVPCDNECYRWPQTAPFHSLSPERRR